MAYNHKKYMKEYYQKNKEKNKEGDRLRSKNWYNQNKDKVILKSKQWAMNNPGRRKITEKQRIDRDYQYFLIKKLKRRLVHALQTLTPDKSLSITEYEIEWDKIANRIINNHPEDRTKVIDHIRPICSFDLYDAEEVKRAFAPENTQLLTKQENLNKIKYDKPQSLYGK